jgi:hypothetical protein
VSQKAYQIKLDKNQIIVLTKTLFRSTILLERDAGQKKRLNVYNDLIKKLTEIPMEELDKHEEVVYNLKRKEVKELKELVLDRIYGIKEGIIPKYNKDNRFAEAALARELLKGYEDLNEKLKL